MQVGKRQFSPGWFPTIITILLLPVLISLGIWQLDRAEQKREMYRVFIDRQEAAPVNLIDSNIPVTNTEQLLWRHVNVSGEFITDRIILLDNQVVDGVPGYFVFTPFRLTDEDVLVLVNRGWIAGSGNRSEIPEIETATGAVNLIAVAVETPATGILLQQHTIETLTNSMYRVQRIDINEMKELINHDFLPYVLRLEPESEHGFKRQWQVPGSGEEKHLGYAFQWFALAVTLLIIYIVVNTRKTV